MRFLIINVVCGIHSTGRICTDLAFQFESQGHQVKVAYGRGKVPEQYMKYAVRIGNDVDVLLHGLKARVFDAAGFGSKRITEKFIEWIKKYDPDVIHLHNLHGYYINIEVLFDYLRTCNKKILWTLHDCWAFTGHCTYFTYVKCNKWKQHCCHCPQKRKYPSSFWLDRSSNNFEKKKNIFCGVNNMTIITPSEWLAKLVKDSYLRDYKVNVHNNIVDRSVFKNTPSDFKLKYKIGNSIIVLGVANIWEDRKGLVDFIQLSSMLGREYTIVLVGLRQNEYKKAYRNYKKVKRETLQIDTSPILRSSKGTVVPANVYALYKEITGKEYDKKDVHDFSRVILIERTKNVTDLAKIYSMADFFVNPTREENYPTVNLEAGACGTYIITYDTGGCSETI